MYLMHWAGSLLTRNEDFIENVQSNISVWGPIVQSIGGLLEAFKFSLFLLTYKWTGGRACLKTLRNFPDAPYTVVRGTP